MFAFIVFRFFKKSDDIEEKEREYNKKKRGFVRFVPVILFVSLIVYLYSGYFRFWTIAIASGSMEPKISIGDLVLIDRKYDKNSIKKGQIIAYKNSDNIIVHRINEIVISKNETYYITKGDANDAPDTIIIDEEMVLGVVKFKIPYIGLPTIWLHEMMN